MYAFDFVSVNQIKIALRIDHDEEDSNLENLISAASRAIAVYIQMPTEPFADTSGQIPFDTAGDPIVPEDVQHATIMLVGIWFRDPDGTEMEKWQQGYLPFAVTAGIYHYRTPSVA
jgi:hypothetical protein